MFSYVAARFFLVRFITEGIQRLSYPFFLVEKSRKYSTSVVLLVIELNCFLGRTTYIWIFCIEADKQHLK